MRKAKWPDLLKDARAGKLQFWQLGGTRLDARRRHLARLALRQEPAEGNLAHFKLPEYDRLYEKARGMPDSPERTRLYQDMARLVVAYAPWKVNTHRIRTDMWYPLGDRVQAIADAHLQFLEVHRRIER